MSDAGKPDYELVRGSARNIPLQDSCVQTAVVSPPYWALRAYEDVPAEIWGGDAGHQHEWAGANEGHCACGAWRGQLGLEPHPDLYVEHVVEIMREVRRVLRPDGCAWLNIGDSYIAHTGSRDRGLVTRRQFDPSKLPNKALARHLNAEYGSNLKLKDMALIPESLAPALQRDGWWVRARVVWEKPNQIPGDASDRPVSSHELVYLLSKRERYFWDKWDVMTPRASGVRTRPSGAYPKAGQAPAADNHSRQANRMRLLRDVWRIPTQAWLEGHFATFPERVPEICVRAGTPVAGCCAECGTPRVRVIRNWTPVGWCDDCRCGAPSRASLVLDPCAGVATTGVAALKLGRRFVGIEPSAKYLRMARQRLDPIGAAQADVEFAAREVIPLQGALAL